MKTENHADQWALDLDNAGGDMQAARAVFNRVRDSPSANATEREEFFTRLAHQSVHWFIEALYGRPLSADEFREIDSSAVEFRQLLEDGGESAAGEKSAGD